MPQKPSQPLPDKIQFQFVNIHRPETIEMMFDLHVYMGDEDVHGEPVLYRVVIMFTDDEEIDRYTYTSAELFEQHNIEPYDHKQLESLLGERIDDILEDCQLNHEEPLGEQLSKFLAAFGSNNEIRFYL